MGKGRSHFQAQCYKKRPLLTVLFYVILGHAILDDDGVLGSKA